MRKYLLGLTGLVLMVGVFTTGVSAVGEDIAPTTSNAETARQGLGDTREKRVEAYKDKLRTNLNQSEQNKLKATCASAQGNIKSLTSRINNFSSKRATVFENLKTKMTNLLTRLETSGVDTSSLLAPLTGLQTQVQDFSTDLDDYQIILTDLSEMDCTADPTAFKAALEEAREKRVELKQQTDTIKAYFAETIKPILQTIKSDLMTKTESTTSSETAGDN